MCVMFTDLPRLFANPLRVKVIKFFALQPDERFSAAQLVQGLSIKGAKIQPELAALVRTGVVTVRGVNTARTYGWNRQYRGASALQAFIFETTTPDDKTIADAFKKIGVHAIVAAGILAEETRGAVDLLVITRRPKDPRIAGAVKKLESASASPLRYAVMDVGEFQSRLTAFDRMLRDIMDFRHRVVLGHVMGGA
jgi:hypothetical protein